MIRKKILSALCFLILSGILICGCSDDQKLPEALAEKKDSSGPSKSGSSKGGKNAGDKKEQNKTPRDHTPKVLMPEASGTQVFNNDFVTIDASHTDAGYFMVKYLGTNKKVKLRINGPDQSEYVYLLSGTDGFETFPLSGGSGAYLVQILENAGGDMYAVAYSADLDVSIADEFSPFLYPNQYVNFTKDSLTVQKGSELAEGAGSDLEVIENIYHYVTSEITYDEKKAASVTYGYLPVIDETLKSGKGICFDYASVMSAMLRTQGIPTKLEVGYSGEAYHAWISAYVSETGWVEDIIEFDGKSWTLMDPTLAANNSASSVKQYIGDGSNYVVKYSY